MGSGFCGGIMERFYAAAELSAQGKLFYRRLLIFLMAQGCGSFCRRRSYSVGHSRAAIDKVCFI